MRKSFTTFAATLAAAGLLSLGSVTVGQDTAEPSQTPPPATEQASENVADTASDNPEVAKDTSDASADSLDNSFMENSNETTDAANQENVAADEAEEAATNEQQNVENKVENSEQKAEQSANNGQTDAKEQSDSLDEQRASSKENKAKQDDQGSLVTPPVPEQARDSAANSDAPRDANWRMVGYQNQWWYYTPQGQWMIRQGNQWRPYNASNARSQRTYDDARMTANRQSTERYSTGYRGVDETQSTNSQTMIQQSAAQLHYDRCGRAFICENGHRVYVQVEDHGRSYTSNKVTTSNSQPTLADESEASSYSDTSGDADNIGRPTPVRDQMRSIPPAPPKAE